MWKTLDRFLDLRSRWMALIGEHLQDESGKVLEYWRVEKADSMVVVVLQGDRLILPQRMYRPGVQGMTLDFPGGRVPEGEDRERVVATILQRELGIALGAIARVQWLNGNSDAFPHLGTGVGQGASGFITGIDRLSDGIRSANPFFFDYPI